MGRNMPPCPLPILDADRNRYDLPPFDLMVSAIRKLAFSSNAVVRVWLIRPIAAKGEFSKDPDDVSGLGVFVLDLSKGRLGLCPIDPVDRLRVCRMVWRIFLDADFHILAMGLIDIPSGSIGQVFTIRRSGHLCGFQRCIEFALGGELSAHSLS